MAEHLNCPRCGAHSQADAENFCCGEDCPLPDTGDDFATALVQFNADVAADVALAERIAADGVAPTGEAQRLAMEACRRLCAAAVVHEYPDKVICPPAFVVAVRAAMLALRAAGVASIQASSVSYNCDGLILADGYIGGSMLSSPVEHKVTLRYRTCEQADAAFDVISTLIDNANGVQSSDGGQKP